MIINFLESPYSLGKLIDWKHILDRILLITWILISPYSLGKLIDWKLKPESELFNF
jgi:hypothetical protein